MIQCPTKAVVLKDGSIHRNHPVNPTYVQFVVDSPANNDTGKFAIDVAMYDPRPDRWGVRWLFDDAASHEQAYDLLVSGG